MYLIKNKHTKIFILLIFLLSLSRFYHNTNKINLDKNKDSHIEHKENANTLNSNKVSPLTDEEVKNVFDGIWTSQNDSSGENIYLKIRENRYEFHTNKMCSMNYETISKFNIDKENRTITLFLETHDGESLSQRVQIKNSNEIMLSTTNGDVKYSKLKDKEFAIDDLSESWKIAFGPFKDNDICEYPIDDFIE